MLAIDRKRDLLQMLEQRGTVRVADLAQRYGITEETVRRDLDELQQEGHLRRVYGGAVALRGTEYEATITERESRNLGAKRDIARAALGLVEPEDTLLFDASTTVLELARALPDMACTVITNSLRVASELASRSQVEVICLGGRLRKRSQSFVGPLTLRALQDCRVDKAFVSCKGLDLAFGASESNELESELKRVMLASARRTVVLADASKLGRSAFARFASLNMLHVLITDQAAQPEFLEQLRQQQIEVLVATHEGD